MSVHGECAHIVLCVQRCGDEAQLLVRGPSRRRRTLLMAVVPSRRIPPATHPLRHSSLVRVRADSFVSFCVGVGSLASHRPLLAAVGQRQKLASSARREPTETSGWRTSDAHTRECDTVVCDTRACVVACARLDSLVCVAGSSCRPVLRLWRCVRVGQAGSGTSPTQGGETKRRVQLASGAAVAPVRKAPQTSTHDVPLTICCQHRHRSKWRSAYACARSRAAQDQDHERHGQPPGAHALWRAAAHVQHRVLKKLLLHVVG